MSSIMKRVLESLFPTRKGEDLLHRGPDVASAREWIAATSGHEAEWSHLGTLDVNSGDLFIGDPSWGSDYHLQGARSVPAEQLDIWLLASQNQRDVHVVWLEACGTPPVSVAGGIEFGVDSAYFAFGDRLAGEDLACIGDLNLPNCGDSFEFFLPHIQDENFTWVRLEVPPVSRLVYAVNTRNDGGLNAAWLQDKDNGFTGILVDISGRTSDLRFIDTLLPGQG